MPTQRSARRHGGRRGAVRFGRDPGAAAVLPPRPRDAGQLGRPAPPAVDAVRLVFGGHAARYGSRRLWRPAHHRHRRRRHEDPGRGRRARRNGAADRAPGHAGGVHGSVSHRARGSGRRPSRRIVAAVGIGIPSTIDQRDGTSVFSVHVPLEGIPLRERAEQYLGVPVAIDNDANARRWPNGRSAPAAARST